MSTGPKLDDLQDKDVAKKQADDQAAVEKAVTPGDAPKRSKGEQKAEDAELKRQEEIRDAVAEAHEKELPKLGGPILEPGLGR